MQNPAFIKRLVTERILTPEEAKTQINAQKKDAYAIARTLIQKGTAEKDVIGKLWGDTIGYPYVNLEKSAFQKEVAGLINEKFARANYVVPIYQFGKAVTVAFANPSDATAVRNVERLAGCPVSPVFAFFEDVKNAINRQFGAGGDAYKEDKTSLIVKLTHRGGLVTETRLKELAGEQALAVFSRELILQGIKAGASDIHIDPGEKQIKIRFRIDGVLHDTFTLETALLLPLVASFKLLADMDIAERRKPQDGRITWSDSGKSVDVRFSSVPTIYGEKIVLRILAQSNQWVVPDLADLDFSYANQQQIERVLKMPNGMFLVSGPTGSGKTTTLFAMLKALNKPGVNIMTIEDPVEYRLAGANQSQVNPAIDFHFEDALRHFLRQDPDIILIGEIRDLETARIAVKASLTGHLVFTTAHTNNALQVITRLLDLGVEPYMAASSINGVMAQRLVRKICSHCKEKYRLSHDEALKYFTWEGQKEIWFSKGNGCDQCNQTGYSGRMAIHEIYTVNNEMRQLITHNDAMETIKACAKKQNFKPFYYDGLKKVLAGRTTIDEVCRVSYEES